MAIWKNIYKYLKFFLVHPATEIIIKIIYFISFVFIGILIFKESSIYDDHQILDMTESYLYFNTFKYIKSPSQFNSYLLLILDKLYTINPRTDEIPLFIPMNQIRLIQFTNTNDCNEGLNYSLICKNEPEKFKCVIDNLIQSFKLKCGKKYSDEKKVFQKKLQGYYSSYNIRDANNYIDITKETYYSTYQNQINEIIEDKQLKAIIMQINLMVPSNNNFIDVILGVEMTNYFRDAKTIFSVNILNDYRPNTKNLLFLFFIFLFVSIFFGALKLIYEIYVKFIWTVHILSFIGTTFDCLFMIICIIYLIEDKKLDFSINLKKFESHLRYINILWFIKAFYALLVIFFPFKFLSLITWLKTIFEPIIILVNTLFRMGPAIILSFIFFILMSIMFVFINYFLYNDIFPYYETMFQSLISTFNIRIILTLFKRNPASRIFGNLFQSKYSIIFIFFQIVFIYYSIAIIIATLAYAYKRALILQNPETENKYMVKLKEIQAKLENEKNEENSSSDSIKKHILWLNFDGTVSRNDIFKKYEALIFKNTNQIKSFLKYIFAVQPELQFKKLIYKFNIIIETNKITLGEGEMKQINDLIDWLIYVGAKIPIIIYDMPKMKNSLKIKINSLYKLTSFINDEKNLEKIIKNKGEKVLCISESNNFSFS